MCDKTLKSGEAADFLVEAGNATEKVNTASIFLLIYGKPLFNSSIRRLRFTALITG